MKLFTSLHDTLHTLTGHIQSGLKRLRRSAPITTSCRQDSVAQSKPNRSRKHYPWRSRRDAADEKVSKDSSQQRLPRLSGLNFSGIDIAGAVTAASFVDPFTEAKIRHQIQDCNREVLPPTMTESHGHMKVHLPIEIWAQILDHGIWGGNLSFLLAFRSVSRVFNALARHQVPRRVPTCLKHYEGDVMDFASEEIRHGSWAAVEKRLSSSTEYNDFLMLLCDNPGLFSALPHISAASTRRPTSLVIKESPPYGEGHYIAISINNRVRTQLVRLGLTRSVAPDFVGWNTLEELILECPISIGDAFYLLGQTNCRNSLRTATLNINEPQHGPDLDVAQSITMTCLETLTLMGSLPLMHTLAWSFFFPALRDLTLTAIGSHCGDTGGTMYCELRLPWSQLQRLVLRNTATSLTDVFAVLSQCDKVTHLIWSGSLTTGMQPSGVSLSSLEQLTLEGHALDCVALLDMLHAPSSSIRRLALSCYHIDINNRLPRDLEELIVHYPILEVDFLRVLSRLRRSLVRGSFAISAPSDALRLIFPDRPELVTMVHLKYLCLQANHTVKYLLASLMTPKLVQADVRPLPYHLS